MNRYQEGSRLNMASRIDLAMRVERKGQGTVETEYFSPGARVRDL